MAGVLDVLEILGAEKLRDGSFKIELAPLRLNSVFGGSCAGSALVNVAGDALSFLTPPELCACGKMWMPGVSTLDALRNSVVEAHGQLRERVTEGVTSLRRLGFQAKLMPPEPRARGHLQIDQLSVVVALDQNGDLIVEQVAGVPVPVDQRRALIAPDESTAAEALRRVTSVVQTFRKSGGRDGAAKGPISAAAPALSAADLNELQAALSDDENLVGFDADDEDEVEEAEPTTANVPRPFRQTRSSAFDEHEGTHQLAKRGPAVTARDDEDDIKPDQDHEVGTVELRLPRYPSVPQSRIRESRERGLIDSFDDVYDDVSDDVSDDFSSQVEDTAAASRSRPTEANNEDNGLIAALGDEDELDGGGSHALSLDDFPALEDVDNSSLTMNGSPTSVSEPPANLHSLPSAAPTLASLPPLMRYTEVTNADEDADGSEDVVGSEAAANLIEKSRAKKPAAHPHPAPAQPDDSEVEFETQTLNVSQSLLDSLKIKGTNNWPVGTTKTLEFPATLRDPPNAASPAIHAELGRADVMPLLTDLTAHPDGASRKDELEGDGDLAPLDEEIAALSLRAEELTAELVAIHERMASLQAQRGITSAHPPARAHVARDEAPSVRPPVTVGMTTPAEVQRLRALPLTRRAPSKPQASTVAGFSTASPEAEGNHFRSVGQSQDDSAEDETKQQTATQPTSLPNLASIDVKQISDLDGRPPLEGGVSLADLQGALKEMGVELNDNSQTQVAAEQSPLGMQQIDGDGDVFGTSAGSSLVLAERDEQDDSSRVADRPAPRSCIALVVENAQARERLLKHLEPRFHAVFEADGAAVLAQLKALARVDAIVFVRPSASETNLQGFSTLNSLPRRPRILVISSDTGFDNVPGVDLRLPLGQTAPEVVRQVVEGLERLGIAVGAPL